MGWTYSHRERGISHKEWFSQEFSGAELVDIASGYENPTNLYAALKTKDGKTVAVALLTRRAPNSHFNYGYKDMDEGMGPNIHDCPERILDLLSPLEDLFTPRNDGQEGAYDWAKNWRQRAREKVARRKARPKLTDGLLLKLSYPLQFHYSKVDAGEPIKVLDAKRRVFGHNGLRFKLRKATQNDLEVYSES